jgi:hypothetical protein
MLRRLLEGFGLLFLVVVLFNRLDVGFMLPILSGAGVVAFTAWRIYKLWNRYQVHVMVQNQPANRNIAVENEMLALRGHQHARGAELTFWTGFMLGGAMVADAPSFAGDGMAGGAEGGMDIGGGFGGDM